MRKLILAGLVVALGLAPAFALAQTTGGGTSGSGTTDSGIKGSGGSTTDTDRSAMNRQYRN